MESMNTSLLESRRGFLFGTIIIFVTTFTWIVLAASLGIPRWAEYLVIVGPSDSPTRAGAVYITTVAILVCAGHRRVCMRSDDQACLDARA